MHPALLSKLSYFRQLYQLSNFHFFKAKKKLNKKTFLKKNLNAFKIIYKAEKAIRFSINYRIFIHHDLYFENLSLNENYLLNLLDLRNYNYFLTIRYDSFKLVSQNLRLTTLFSFLKLYSFFFFKIANDSFYIFKKNKSRRQRVLYYLILTFKNSKLFINLYNFKKKNYISISSGLFIKFFEKKKTIKKTKTIKLLMIKYLRKLLILTKINNLILIIRKLPVFLEEMLNVLNQKIIHQFFNPFKKKNINELKTEDPFNIKFVYFIFLQQLSYTTNKLKKKGRIKRKIYRKLVLQNQITD